MRLLVCGDRNWADLAMIQQRVAELYPQVVIHGCARGADSLAGLAARNLRIPVVEFPAQWQTYGRAAGMIRNQQMLIEGKPDYVLAFHDRLETSRGTADMVQRARAKGIPVSVYKHE